MLRFNASGEDLALVSDIDLNTSHVKVQQENNSRRKEVVKYLNTSHVKVQHKFVWG